MGKKFDTALISRVRKIREGLGAQPLSMLRAVDSSLGEETGKYRRILCSVVFPGDLSHVEKLEAAKLKWESIQ